MTANKASGTSGQDGQFEPVIIGFTCNWCSYRAADLAGTARMKYPPNIRLLRLMCSGRLDPTFVLKAFAGGADGVMVSGCHPGDCHYVDQNYKALRRYHLLERTLEQLGVERDRLQLTWASAGEGAIFAEAVRKFTEQVRALGPLDWPDDRVVELEEPPGHGSAPKAEPAKVAAEVTA
jgi:F420-non-reducing hydrogenase iron-sulfur subunit